VSTASSFVERAEHVEALFDSLDAEVVAFWTRVPDEDPTTSLHPDEEAAVARSSPRRRREFAAGRACAHAALERLGVASPTVPAGPDRAPIWPDGFVGSISHADGECIAVAGRADGQWHPGIDIEAVGRITDDIATITFTAVERRRFAAADDADAVVTASFAAKEALYKAQHPITGSWVGFSDVEVVVGPRHVEPPRAAGAALTFESVVDLEALGQLRWPVRGRWAATERTTATDLVVAAVVVHPAR